MVSLELECQMSELRVHIPGPTYYESSITLKLVINFEFSIIDNSGVPGILSFDVVCVVSPFYCSMRDRRFTFVKLVFGV